MRLCVYGNQPKKQSILRAQFLKQNNILGVSPTFQGGVAGRL